MWASLPSGRGQDLMAKAGITASAVPGTLHHVGQDLLGRQPHQEQQGDGHAIDGGASNMPPLG